MESKPSSAPHRAEDATWFISAGTWHRAREADACIAADDWLYVAPGPPPRGERRATGSTAPARTPTR